MLDTAYTLLYAVHVPVALSCVPAFWVAVFAKKGGRLHVGAGTWFALGMRFVAVTGMTMALLILADPFVHGFERADSSEAEVAAFLTRRHLFSAFLLYLGVITFFPVHHGVRVIRSRRDPAAIATRAYRLAAFVPLVATVGVLVVAMTIGQGRAVLLMAMSPIGALESVLAWRYLANPLRERMGWWTQHMTFMLIGGITVHTAFSVFFIGSLLAWRPGGFLGILPWVLPPIVGIPVLVVWVRREAKRLGSKA